MVVAEIEGLAETKPGDAVLAVEGRDDHPVAKSELGEHDGQVFVGRPIKDARTVGKGEVVSGRLVPHAYQGQLELKAGVFVPIEKHPVLFSMRLVEDDVSTAHL